MNERVHEHEQAPPEEERAPSAVPFTDGHPLLVLQQTVGNQAVSGLVQRNGMQYMPTPTLTPREQIDKALASKDNDDVHAIKDLSSATDEDRWKLIDILRKQTWVGYFDELALERIWGSFGDIPKAARDHIDVWSDCVSKGADLYEIPVIKAMGLPEKFKTDVKATAHQFMQKNWDDTFEEKRKLAFGKPEEAGASEKKQAEDRIKEIEFLALQAQRAREAKERLLGTYVGYQNVYHYDENGVRDATPDRQPRTFNPQRGPDEGPSGLQNEQGWRKWEEVNEDYLLVEAVITGIGRRSPALYQAIQQKKEGELADPKTSVKTADELLDELSLNITGAQLKLERDELDWRDLAPVQQHLYTHGGGGTDWKDPLNQAAAKEVIAGHERVEFWKTLGLTTLAAAAFIFSEIATGGLATIAWAAVGASATGYTAYRSWEKYGELSAGSKASSTDERQLIAQGQVDAALITAILDTVFAALDAGAAFKTVKGVIAVAEVAQAGAEAAASGLRVLDKMSPAARASAIEHAIGEFGVEQAAKNAGKTPEELLKLAGGMETELGKRIAASMARDSSKLAEGLKLAARGQLSKETAEKLIARGFDDLGVAGTVKAAGGYDKLVKFLGNDSVLAKTAMEWRDGVEADLKAFLNAGREGQEPLIQGTGRRGMPSNDMDMSLLGKDASANREKARAFLAGRLGASPETVEKLLNAQLFIDPRRMHLFDKLPPALQEEMARNISRGQIEMSQNLRLIEAVKAGDTQLAESIRAELKNMGMQELKDFKALGAAERLQLGEQVDKLHGELEKAIETGNEAEQKRLINEIAQREGYMKASEPGAYATSGSVKLNVSERDQLPGYKPGQGPAAGGAERLADVIEQMRYLEDAQRDLLEATTVQEIVPALKKIGKYGGREATSAGVIIKGELRDVVAGLPGRFAEIQKAAEAGLKGAGESEKVFKDAIEALNDLSKSTEQQIVELSKQVGTTGTANLDVVQAQIRFQIKLQRVTALLKTQITTAANLIRLGIPVDFGATEASPAQVAAATAMADDQGGVAVPVAKDKAAGGSEGPPEKTAEFKAQLLKAYLAHRPEIKRRILAALRASGKRTATFTDDDPKQGLRDIRESKWWDCLTNSGADPYDDPEAGVSVDPKADAVNRDQALDEIDQFERLSAAIPCPFFEELRKAELAKFEAHGAPKAAAP